MQRDGELSAPDPSGVHVNAVFVPVTVPVTPGAGRSNAAVPNTDGAPLSCPGR